MGYMSQVRTWALKAGIGAHLSGGYDTSVIKYIEKVLSERGLRLVSSGTGFKVDIVR